MTSLFRELIPAPTALSASTTMTSRPARASALAIASPMTPAPMTRHSTEFTPTSFPGHAAPANLRVHRRVAFHRRRADFVRTSRRRQVTRARCCKARVVSIAAARAAPPQRRNWPVRLPRSNRPLISPKPSRPQKRWMRLVGSAMAGEALIARQATSDISGRPCGVRWSCDPRWLRL